MNNNREYWNNVYDSIKHNKIIYDLWLDKYRNILEKSKDANIIDLGCGSGNDSLYLNERNYKVISCDYSIEALNIVKKYIKNSNVVEMDLTKNFTSA